MNNYIDIENLNLEREKIEIYIKDEEEKLVNLINIFTSINNSLNIGSSVEIERMQKELVDKMKVIDKLHNTDIIMNNSFWVGVYPGMTDEMIDYIAKVIQEAIEQ